MTQRLLILIFMVLSLTVAGTARAGEVILTEIDAPSLSGARYGTPVMQDAIVYTPPSYGEGDKDYPLLIFLPGYATTVRYAGRIMQIGETMDRLISCGKIEEMILVIPNGLSFCLGCFYTDSPLTGNWEEYVTRDVVSWAEKKYRLRTGTENRGICGHSMGGTGALNIAMRHPGTFGAVYALSPGIFDEKGLDDCQLFRDGEMLAEIHDEISALGKMGVIEGEKSFMNNLFSMAVLRGETDKVFFYAYAMAFAYEPGSPPHIAFPFSYDDGTMVKDSETMSRYEEGFGNMPGKISKYRKNLKKLKIGLDCGREDNYQWLLRGCQYFHELLIREDIRHFYEIYEGGHINKLKERMENHVLFFFSEFFKEGKVE